MRHDLQKIQFFKSCLTARTGYGEHGRNYAAALMENGFDVMVVEDGKNPLEASSTKVPGGMKYHGPMLYVTGQHHLYVLPPHQPSIIMTMIENDRLHPRWVEKLKRADAVWVPSRFNYDTFRQAGIDAGRLHIVKAAVNTEAFAQCKESYPFKTTRSYRFLCIFNRLTWYRKGMDVLLNAYYNAFSIQDDVCLVLKTNLSMAELHRLAGITPTIHAPEVEIIDSYLSDTEMLQLYKSSDSYVMPSRGEGIGRPYLYAMLNEMPVIAVNWSGNREFMNHENAFLVDYRLEKIPIDIEKILYVMNFGGRYAEPNTDDLISKMRFVYNHHEQAREKGKIARAEIISNHSYAAVSGQTVLALEHFKASISIAQRTLKAEDIFLNMHPLWFPGNPGDITRQDREFSGKPVRSIAIYGTGAGSRLALGWIRRFEHLGKTIFLDRKREPVRFLDCHVFHYEDFDFQSNSIDMILIGTEPRFVPSILENLKNLSTVPIYLFGP